jgi:hypothetical protein
MMTAFKELKMKNLSQWISQVSKGWLVILALAVFILFIIFVLPAQAEQAEAASGGAGSADSSLFYTPKTLYSFAEAYGPKGRQAYIRARLTFDLAWPLVYTFFLATSLSWLFHRGFPSESHWQRVNLAPVLGLILDYLENGAAVAVMARYPAPTDLAAWLAAVFTPLKWLFVGGSFLLLLIGAAAALWRKIRSGTAD